MKCVYDYFIMGVKVSFRQNENVTHRVLTFRKCS